MLRDLTTALRPAALLLLALSVLTGLLYPLAITGVAQLAMPGPANGSLVRNGERIVGSSLVGQSFASPRYFHGRPSAAGQGYDASASSGSNLGPTSADLKAAITERVAAARAEGVSGPVPADMVTASGSGLDPDISPANAAAQVARVAAARGMTSEALGALVARAVERPVLGEPHVNVLLLNRQLDQAAAQAGR
ncbi:potassium-transporting ATPase subunit KdpC [Sphingomonas astaxanthinifaciens]|uniref:Potassium-transporting ATPase KdpC subunit n=1 Tax=Sphingomonas astaxanthinifaciens DSM 22298 TaxID=1123267 RepID=A0ABQ5ZD59_9SPHN|nr:potassium-transporting ATPase subunit KdpC [Sphingomonas astaxanthinifaciens]GLR48729.1 potassium-transporting ATPase KdpC subunit [Sphingomonas astaxanthinifaciens DSM 22298]